MKIPLKTIQIDNLKEYNIMEQHSTAQHISTKQVSLIKEQKQIAQIQSTNQLKLKI